MFSLLVFRFSPAFLTGAGSLAESTVTKANKAWPPPSSCAAVYLYFCQRHKFVDTATFGPSRQKSSYRQLAFRPVPSQLAIIELANEAGARKLRGYFQKAA